jgi:O-antigen ligase
VRGFVSLVSKLLFVGLVLFIVVSAIPYGTVEPWWKAAFVCAVFAICIVALVHCLVRGEMRIAERSVLLPMLALAALAFLQTLSLAARTEADLQVWNTISADPYQTRFFALQILALTTFLALLYRYANTEHRIRLLIYTILVVAVASALFGILRQTTQQQTGFVLPLLKQNQGYGQFINKNHFAYLMEMAFGLGLGIILAGGIKRDRLMIYLALLLPIWTSLVLANSRGGILAMFTQIIVAVLLLMSLSTMRFALILVLVVGVLFGTFWVGGDRLATNFEATSTEFTQNAAREGASRNEIWRASLKMFAAHPILGVGLGGYWIGITAFHDASGLMTPQEAHNDYLELLSSGGVIGFALGVWFAVAVVRLTRKSLVASSGFTKAAKFGAILGIAGVAAHSLVDFGLHLMANAVVFLTLIMIATTTNFVDRNSQAQ